MTKRILVVLSVMFVFGLFATVFALTGAKDAGEKTASCCPMHKQNNAGATASTEKADACCDMADCCKDGVKDGVCSMGGDCCKDKDSCPMKSQETSSAQSMDMSKVVVVKSGADDCCQPGADCCKGGACCRKKS